MAQDLHKSNPVVLVCRRLLSHNPAAPAAQDLRKSSLAALVCHHLLPHNPAAPVRDLRKECKRYRLPHPADLAQCNLVVLERPLLPFHNLVVLALPV